MRSSDLRHLFKDIEIGSVANLQGRELTLRSKQIFSTLFEGETEYWIEFEYEDSNGLVYLTFDYGEWISSKPVKGGFPLGAKELRGLKRGESVQFGSEKLRVVESGRARVEYVDGLAVDGTVAGEAFHYIDFKSPLGSICVEIAEEELQVFRFETIGEIDALNALRVSTDSRIARKSREMREDDDEDGSANTLGKWIAIVIFGGIFALTWILESCDGIESVEDCRARVQRELTNKGVPAGESIRQADAQCRHSSMGRRHRFGK